MHTFPNIKNSIIYLASRCDGAHSLDGMGFKGCHSPAGKAMAEVFGRGSELKLKTYLKAGRFCLAYTNTQLTHIGVTAEMVKAEMERIQEMIDNPSLVSATKPEKKKGIIVAFSSVKDYSERAWKVERNGQYFYLPKGHSSKIDDSQMELTPWIFGEKRKEGYMLDIEV